MPSNQKPVIDKNIPAQVEFRDGVKVVIFKTTEGTEVLLWRDRDGYVKRVVSVEVEAVSLGEARNIAIKLLPNPILKKDAYHLVKVVDPTPWPTPEAVKSKGVGVGRKPAWQDERLAEIHRNQLVTHNPNDD